MQRWGQVGYQLFQDLKNEAILDHLNIVQNQQEPAFQCQDVVDEGRTDDLAGGQLSGAQDALDLPAQVRIYLLQGSDEIGKKAPGVIIGRIQGQPGHRPALQGTQPFTDAGRFSKPGRRRYQRDLPPGLQPFVQLLDEMWTLDSLGRRGGLV